uniref:Haemolysin-III related n=1 Tax=viral metagenome TaxID=1070528 RepID=A0A6C0HI29_9ZZZZ
MNKYTFPFNSCEVPQNNGVAQPYSTTINFILCCIIIYYLLKSNNLYSRLFLVSILIFNIFHTFSHTTHVKNFKHSQFFLTHFSAIGSTLFFLLLLNHVTKKKLMNWQIYTLLFLYLFDIYIITQKVSHIYNIITFLILLFLIMLFNYSYLSGNIKQSIIYIIFFSAVVLFFQIFEIINCQYILKNFNYFPFHIITEFSACIPIYLLCNSFYKI